MWGIIEPYRLDPAKKYTLEEITDRILKSWFGPEHGLEYFKKQGFIKWPKKIEERYWRPFQKWRTPIYFEHFIKVGNQVKKVLKENGLENIGLDTDDYQALPDWKPCPAYDVKDPEYDLYSIYFRVPLHTFSSTYNNAWLDEVCQADPYVYNILINTETAKRKRIKDGD